MLPLFALDIIANGKTSVQHILIHSDCVCVFREGGEDGDSQGDGSSQPDTISIASRTSQNTVDSDKVGNTHTHTHTSTTHTLSFSQVEGWMSWRQLIEPRVCVLWRPDDPQLSQHYRVSRTSTIDRSRGCACAQSLCVLSWKYTETELCMNAAL